MFTKNWYTALISTMSYKELSYTNINGDTKATHPSYARYCIDFCNSSGVYVPNLNTVLTTTDGKGGVIFGTGTTPPTIDDYYLSGNLITSFTALTSVNVLIDDDGCTFTTTYTLTNTSENDFTVGEIGIMCNPASTGSAAASKALYERTVLDTPITIPAGGIGVVTYTIRMNYPA